MNKDIEISIILPSLRQHAAAEFIDWINAQKAPVSYEIVLVSPFSIDRPNVAWVEDKGPFDGYVRAANTGFRASRGRFISIASDDAFYDTGWWKIIDFIKKIDRNRKYRIAGYKKIKLNKIDYLRKHRSLYAYLRFFFYKPHGESLLPVKMESPETMMKRIKTVTKKLLGMPIKPQLMGANFACWFCVERSTVEKLMGGELYRKEYHTFYADNDLGMRLFESGEPVLFCKSARMIVNAAITDDLHSNNENKYLKLDKAAFDSFWKDKYYALE